MESRPADRFNYAPEHVENVSGDAVVQYGNCCLLPGKRKSAASAVCTLLNGKRGSVSARYRQIQPFFFPVCPWRDSPHCIPADIYVVYAWRERGLLPFPYCALISARLPVYPVICLPFAVMPFAETFISCRGMRQSFSFRQSRRQSEKLAKERGRRHADH